VACRQACRKQMQQYVYYHKRRLKEILYDALANGSSSFSDFADRMLDHFDKLFLFTRYQEMESTNNAAERTLRHIVLWRKTSYGTQSLAGSRFLERAISIWMTLKKQGREVLPFFQQAYQSTFCSETLAPTI
jgi:transposase